MGILSRGARTRAKVKNAARRMDYTLVSTWLASRVMEDTVLGSVTADGTGRSCFFGSNHCPILLKLREHDGEGEAVPVEEPAMENGAAAEAAAEDGENGAAVEAAEADELSDEHDRCDHSLTSLGDEGGGD